MKYSLIIPIYNEEQTLKKLLLELESFQNSIQIILINDGSTDSSKSILNNQTSYKVIHNTENMGKGFSLINAVDLVETQNIILMDGDCEIELKIITDLIKEYESTENHVLVGSRWNKKSKSGKNINTYGNYVINYFFNILYKTNLSDVLCCVKIMKKELFESLNLKSKGFNIEMELMTKLALRNIKFLEKNVIYERRSKDKGKKIRLSHGWGIIWEMINNKLFISKP